jgi:glycosyltransferase involved in cell wall biosynthesis
MQSKEVPSVSIVIPCRNELKYIGKCLDSIVYCNYPKDKLSVYVCDGRSDDGTDLIIKEYAEKHPFIHYLENTRQTTQHALNLGIETSTADIRIILGAHAEIDPDYIKYSIEAFDVNPKIGCTGGIIENVIEDETTSVIARAMGNSFGVGNAHFRTGGKEGYVDTVAFGAYRKEVFEKAGLFDADLARNQDDEFNYRIQKHGFLIYLSKKIKSKYFVRSGFQKVYRQYYQYGYWKVFVNKKHKAITTVRQLIPFFFVSFLFFFPLLFFISLYFVPAYVAIVLLYAAMAIYFGIKETGRADTGLKVAYSFFLLHFSYGLGYLKGIIDFFIFNKKPGQKETRLSR